MRVEGMAEMVKCTRENGISNLFMPESLYFESEISIIALRVLLTIKIKSGEQPWQRIKPPPPSSVSIS
jgi:hypothetical protein